MERLDKIIAGTGKYSRREVNSISRRPSAMDSVRINPGNTTSRSPTHTSSSFL